MSSCAWTGCSVAAHGDKKQGAARGNVSEGRHIPVGRREDREACIPKGATESSTMSDDLQTLATAALRRPPDDSGAAPPYGPSIDACFDSLTKEDNPRLQVESARTLVAISDRLQREVENFAIPVLMKRPRSDDEHTKAQAGEMVRQIVNGDNELRPNLDLGPMVLGVMGDDLATQIARTTDLGWILCIRPDPPIQEVVESGIVPTLVVFLLRDEHPELQRKAAWVLSSITALKPKHAKVAVDYGAIPALVRLLRSPNVGVKDRAARVLANISFHSPQYRDLVLQEGAVQPLRALLRQDSTLDGRRNAALALRNLNSGEPLPTYELIEPEDYERDATAAKTGGASVNGDSDLNVNDLHKNVLLVMHLVVLPLLSFLAFCMAAMDRS